MSRFAFDCVAPPDFMASWEGPDGYARRPAVYTCAFSVRTPKDPRGGNAHDRRVRARARQRALVAAIEAAPRLDIAARLREQMHADLVEGVLRAPGWTPTTPPAPAPRPS